MILSSLLIVDRSVACLDRTGGERDTRYRTHRAALRTDMHVIDDADPLPIFMSLLFSTTTAFHGLFPVPLI